MKKPILLFFAALLWVLPAAAQNPAQNPTQDNVTSGLSNDGPAPLATTDEAAELIRETLERDFADMLPFPMTEEKMVAFTRAALRVEKINAKWDVQIASVESEKMAMEYNLLAVEEISSALKAIDGLSLDEYEILTALTVEDKKFAKVYQAYRQLVRDKYFPEPPPKAAPVPMPETAKPITNATSIQAPVAAGTAALPSAPAQAPQRAVVTPPAAPEGPGNAPTPQGSPTPPYSTP